MALLGGQPVAVISSVFSVSVRPALTRADLLSWVRFPRLSVYPPDSPWVPPPDGDTLRVLDRRANPAFRHGDALPLLAVDGAGKPVGRVLAHVSHRHNVFQGERAAFFGHFECVNEAHVAQALLEAAARFGLRHGCTLLRGPIGLGGAEEVGVLIAGFDQPPAAHQSYSAPYYPQLLELVGLQGVLAASTFHIDQPERINSAGLLDDRHRLLLTTGRVTIKSMTQRDLTRELESLRDIANDAYSRHPYFVPRSRDELRFEARSYRSRRGKSMCLVAEVDGVPCGFVLAVPDSNAPWGGTRSSPSALWRRASGKPTPPAAVVVTMAVARPVQNRGIARLLNSQLVRAVQQAGYEHLSFTWIADDNAPALASVLALGARATHRLSVYEAPINAEGRLQP